MGVIDETAQWVATVYQIETGDPANGGPDAPDNVQARALADRTLYLKNEVEALEASVAGIDLSVFLETADLLNAVKAVDGAGSGLDADLLDGLHASAFARTSDLTGLLATANLLTAMKAVDGAGSGLDADLLDGLHASAFARTSDLTGLLATANLLTAMKAVDGAGSGLDADLLDGLHASAFARTSDLTGLLATANLLTAMKAVDGAGSGLDADLLDGLHASQFLRSDVNDTITATLTANRLDAAFRHRRRRRAVRRRRRLSGRSGRQPAIRGFVSGRRRRRKGPSLRRTIWHRDGRGVMRQRCSTLRATRTSPGGCTSPAARRGSAFSERPTPCTSTHSERRSRCPSC
jgi:hypothetical protein